MKQVLVYSLKGWLTSALVAPLFITAFTAVYHVAQWSWGQALTLILATMVFGLVLSAVTLIPLVSNSEIKNAL